MPQDWVPPAVFMTHNGVDVFHIYRNDQFQSGPRENWFGMSENCSDDDLAGEWGWFDVRELDEWDTAGGDTKEAIKLAIDAKKLSNEEPYIHGTN